MANRESYTNTTEESLHISQSMIDVYSQRLIGLRTQCATSAELTQQEIRSLEGKLIKMFSSQLAVKAELRRRSGNAELLNRYERIPNLEQWLHVVGLKEESVKAVCEKVGSLEELQEKDCWDQVEIVLEERRDELDRLSRAMDNLRRYTAMVREGIVSNTLSSNNIIDQISALTSSSNAGSNISLLECCNQQGQQQQFLTADHDDIIQQQQQQHTSQIGGGSTSSIPPLYWDSWDRRSKADGGSQASSPRPARPRPSYRASIPNEYDGHGGGGVTGDTAGIATAVDATPPTVVVSPTSLVIAVVACPSGGVESVAVPPASPLLCNGGAVSAGTAMISASVSSSALYYGGGSVGKTPASPVSPTFSLTRKPPGLSNCRTPPACRKNTCLPSNSVLPPLCGTPTSLDFPTNLTKSKSHESQLASDQQQQNSPTTTTTNVNGTNNADTNQYSSGVSTILSSPHLRRERLPTEPGPEYGSTYDVAQLLDIQQHHQHHQQQHQQQLYTTTTSSAYRQVHVNVDDAALSGSTGSVVGVSTVTCSQTAPPSPRVLRHRIAHRFQKTFKMMASCAVCLKPIYFGTGLRCKECKYRCHRDCEDKAVPSCGLTQELLEAVKSETKFPGGTNVHVTSSGNCLPCRKNSAPPSQLMYGGGLAHLQGYHQQQQTPLRDNQFGGSGFLSNLLYNKHKHNHHQPHHHNQQQQQHQQQQQQLLPSGGGTNKHHSSSSTNSSCNSSAPSSPAPPSNLDAAGAAVGGSVGTKSSVSSCGGGNACLNVTRSSFHFPDPPITLDGTTTTLLDHLQLKDRANMLLTSEYNSTNQQEGAQHHQAPLSPLMPPMSPMTPLGTRRVDSQDSQVSSDTETLIDGMMGGGSATITTTPSEGGGNKRQNSMTTALKEWDIPFGELILEGPGPLGSGRFGTVWRGQWHGDVAIKVLHGQDEARTLHQFRADVSTFRKTRHENLVLFMGACTRPPHLAIVTSLCKGQTLHTLVHLRRERFSLSKAAAIAQQISQGMGYLHAKGILHKDLTSKNVFLENQGTKVVITDFGLFSGLRNDRAVQGNNNNNNNSCRLAVPAGWLCYLAPELVRALTPTPPPAAAATPPSASAVAVQQQQQLPFSRAADVFAFGTLWFELLCGDWPFRGEPPEAVIWQVGAGRKVSLTNLHATKDVKDVLMACWAYNPADREDFPQLLERLRRLPTAKRLARSPSHPVHLSRSAESVF